MGTGAICGEPGDGCAVTSLHGERADKHHRRKWDRPPHGHDPQAGKLAIVPRVPFQTARERRDENCCLMTGRTYRTALPNLKDQGGTP